MTRDVADDLYDAIKVAVEGGYADTYGGVFRMNLPAGLPCLALEKAMERYERERRKN